MCSQTLRIGKGRPTRNPWLEGGAAGSIFDAGGSFAQLLKAGQWRSLAYRPCLDMGVEAAKAVAFTHIEVPVVGGPGRQGKQGEGIPSP